MKILIPSGASGDSAAYLAEILNTFGLCFVELGTAQQVVQRADPTSDVILLPHGAEARIESFLAAGGSVVAIQPGRPVIPNAGVLDTMGGNASVRLRLAQAICPAARAEPLWTICPFIRYDTKPGPHVIAYLYRREDFGSECAGIWESAVGAGRLVVYAYDPAACIARLRQGNPDRANFLPPGTTTPRASYLHGLDGPPDAAWRPTADLHALLLCEIIQRLLSRHAPAPKLWHIPDGKPSIVLWSGDEDGAPQEANDQEMRDLESFGGAMDLYVIPTDTSITKERISDYTRRGHAISVHPNLVPAERSTLATQLALAEQQVKEFQKRFDQPVRTIRNHRYTWPGYLELPELWERLGIGLDANCTALLYKMSSEFGPFLNINAAVPLRFVRDDGRLIDVYQQPTHLNDDVSCHPTNDYSQKYSPEQFDFLVQRIFADATQFFHSPICVNMHPSNYVSFANAHARRLLDRAKEFGLSIWSLDRWHDWWRSRASWRMTRSSWDGSRLSMNLDGQPCAGITLAVPAKFAEQAVRSVQIGNDPAQWTQAVQNGRHIAFVTIPAGSKEVAVTVTYQATR